MDMTKRRLSKALILGAIENGQKRRIQYSLTNYSSFSVKHFDSYKAKVSHMTETYNEKAHQIDMNIERNLLSNFQKDKRNVSPCGIQTYWIHGLVKPSAHESKNVPLCVQKFLKNFIHLVKFPHFLAKLSPYISRYFGIRDGFRHVI